MGESMSANSKMVVFMDEESIPGRMACNSGEFKNGKRNGEGNLAKPKGKVEIRHWEKSKKLVA